MLPSLEVVKGEGPSLEPLLCLFFPSMLAMLRSSNALLTELPGRAAFSEFVFSMSSWIENCAKGRPRAGGDPDEAFTDMPSLTTTRQ